MKSQPIISTVMEANHYVFTKHGVCTNGTVVYSFSDPGNDPWMVVKIVVAEFKGLWDAGFLAVGCCSPLTNEGKCLTREAAVEQAIRQIKVCFEEDRGLGDFTVCKDHFFNWVASRRQLSLF
jgi:hypothetical protein